MPEPEKPAPSDRRATQAQEPTRPRTTAECYADELDRQVGDYGLDAPDEDPHEAYAKAALRAGAAALRAPSDVPTGSDACCSSGVCTGRCEYASPALRAPSPVAPTEEKEDARLAPTSAPRHESDQRAGLICGCGHSHSDHAGGLGRCGGRKPDNAFGELRDCLCWGIWHFDANGERVDDTLRAGTVQELSRASATPSASAAPSSPTHDVACAPSSEDHG